MKDGVLQITLSDSDSDFLAPHQPPLQHCTPRGRLKLTKPSGELIFLAMEEVE